MNESFGHYELQELIGQGNSGELYRALDTTKDLVVALRLLPPKACEDSAFEERFRHEAHIAAGLTDPHVVPINNYGEIDGRLYLDMRLIDGRDLSLILKDGPLTPRTAVHYVEQVAEALDAAYDAGLVHGDVKASNILVTARDFVYLTDFGLGQGAEDESGEARPDVYALAGVLYECLTGKAPFVDDTAKPPTPFDAVIEKALAKDPSDRYPTALELAAAARKALPRTARLRAALRRQDKPSTPEQQPMKIAETGPEEKTASTETKTATKTRPVDQRPVDHSDTGGYWAALWILLLIATAVLVVVVMEIV